MSNPDRIENRIERRPAVERLSAQQLERLFGAAQGAAEAGQE